MESTRLKKAAFRVDSAQPSQLSRVSGGRIWADDPKKEWVAGTQDDSVETLTAPPELSQV